ncbi:alpha/beta-hydrolase [Xylariaceae sp. FL1651]|nr:alpha/beta-hydrolase [Xylariaceae sp. FL1651]
MVQRRESMATSLKYTLHHYGSTNYLQKVGVWEVDPSNQSKYWIVYIHGGAWRDPRVALESFAPSINHILGTSAAASGDKSGDVIAGFASIDYRLSPHPAFPQDPATTPADEYRGARHPDHLDDVRAALVFLQRTYGFGGNYVLVGHSAGGALAFQLLATSPSPSPSSPASSGPSASIAAAAAAAAAHPVLPAAIVCFEGLYDFSGINARYGGAYAPFFAAAFGEEPEAWDAAAPIKFAGSYAEKWPGKSFVLLGSSPDDVLVDELEAEGMARRLRDKDGFRELGEEGEEEERGGENRLLWLKDLEGDHDEIWQDGEHVARIVWIALREIGAAV